MGNIEKVTNEPEFIILQDGSKIDLKKHEFVLCWGIGKENIVTANFSKKNSNDVSNILFRTSLACRLYDIGMEWDKALDFAINEEQKASAKLYYHLKKNKK